MGVDPRAGLALLILAAGCGGGADDDGGFEESTPILELAPRIARSCNVVSPTTEIGDGLTSDFDRVTLGGRHHALTTRTDATIALAPLGLEPIALGAPVWSASTTAWTYSPAAAPRDPGGLVVVWPENDLGPPEVHRVAIAVLDETGAQVGATRYVTRSVEVEGPQLVLGPAGYTLAWTETAYDTRPRPSMWQLALDGDGAPQREPSMFVEDGAGGLIRHGAGFAVAWSAYEGDRYVSRVALLDPSGALPADPWVVPVPSGHYAYAPTLVSLGADVLIAWTEHFSPGEGDENGYAIVRLARMSDDGTVGPIQRLQAPEPGMVNVNPTFAQVDGALVLSWSRGDYIAVCGGCMSDNDMHLVQLDPADLAPISNVATLGGPSGLRSAPIATLDGRDFAYLLAIDRHARFDFAAAMVRCDALP
ncbi:MAG TPA: hypothetical protein VM261_26235 [Kofleriaceae bacterium]|nr:hypothetical protein [Kofleriaceae bacterium]